MFELPPISLKNKVSKQEWQLRVDLAAAYRLVAHWGWDDIIYTHMSARVPGSEHFLVNAFGLSFEEVSASNLVKVDLNGKIIDDTPHKINPAGFTIHSAIHQAREDAHCVIHLHTVATTAVASQSQGLLPISQHSLFPLSSLSYHDYEGLAVNAEECLSLQQDMGNNHTMLLRNHGGLTLGDTVGDALMRFHDLQRACEIQLAAQASGQSLTLIKPSILDGIIEQCNTVHSGTTGGQKAWGALMRKAIRLDPSFMD